MERNPILEVKRVGWANNMSKTCSNSSSREAK